LVLRLSVLRVSVLRLPEAPVPDCAACERYLTPNSVEGDGSCPHCGEAVTVTTDVHPPPKVPWHFWLVLFLAGAYLAWRAVQGLIALGGAIV